MSCTISCSEAGHDIILAVMVSKGEGPLNKNTSTRMRRCETRKPVKTYSWRCSDVRVFEGLGVYLQWRFCLVVPVLNMSSLVECVAK